MRIKESGGYLWRRLPLEHIFFCYGYIPVTVTITVSDGLSSGLSS